MNFIKTLIVVFRDILKKEYTLIKCIPNNIKRLTQINNNDKLRLYCKPILMQKEGFLIKYDYVDMINKEKVLRLEDIIVNNRRKCSTCQYFNSDYAGKNNNNGTNNKKYEKIIKTKIVIWGKVYCVKCLCWNVKGNSASNLVNKTGDEMILTRKDVLKIISF